MRLPQLIIGAISTALIGIGGVRDKIEHKAFPTPARKKAPVVTVVALPQPLPHFDDFGLTIDKISLKAPVIPNVDGVNEKIYLTALTRGVGQYKGTRTPDVNGNLFIFGHSSYVKSSSGKFKQAFKKLNQLKVGDTFSVVYKNATYQYRVTKSFLTTDEDWSILDPTPKDAKDKTVTLMTCWPPGTIKKRWVVFATQV